MRRRYFLLNSHISLQRNSMHENKFSTSLATLCTEMSLFFLIVLNHCHRSPGSRRQPEVEHVSSNVKGHQGLFLLQKLYIWFYFDKKFLYSESTYVFCLKCILNTLNNFGSDVGGTAEICWGLKAFIITLMDIGVFRHAQQRITGRSGSEILAPNNVKSVKLAVFYEKCMLYMPTSFYISHLSPISSTLVPDNISGRKLVWSSINIFPSFWISFPSESKAQIKP